MAASHSSAFKSAQASSRIDWVDTSKGICICLVVMMHTTLGLGDAVGHEGWLHTVVAFALPFRMPDFFMISGLFLSRVIDRDWRTYADKRIVHFAYFYVLWMLIQFAIKGWSLSGGDPVELLRQLGLALIDPFSTLWFIYLLAVFSAVTKLLRGAPIILLIGLAAALQIAPIHTGWMVIDEFCERWVYFLVGYAFAPAIFALQRKVAAKPLAAVAGLGVWALINGYLALTPTDLALFPTLASLPVISLVLGVVGAVGVVTVASLLTRFGLARPFQYCGRNSIVIYLAFFLPMAAMRTIFIKLGWVGESYFSVGNAALAITVAGVIVPLVLARLVRGTALDVLFVRPQAFRLKERGMRLAPAE